MSSATALSVLDLIAIDGCTSILGGILLSESSACLLRQLYRTDLHMVSAMSHAVLYTNLHAFGPLSTSPISGKVHMDDDAPA